MSDSPNSARADRAHRKYAKLILLAVIAALVCMLLFFGGMGHIKASADDGGGTDDTASQIIDALDGDALDALLESLTERARSIFGGGSFTDVIAGIISGDLALDYSGLFSYILSLLGTSLDGVLWLLITIIAVAVMYAVVGGIKSKFSSETISKTVHIASMISVLAIVASTTYTMIDACRNMISMISTQMSVIFPIIFSLMTAMGASTTAAVYQPALAVISSGVMELVSSVLIPMVLFAFVFMTVGSVSGEMKLTKMSEFLLSAVKWLLGTAFFIMCAFMSVQGITASIYDSVSIRTAKFTMSKYLPVIGTYLSEGINLVLSGSVIVKNAVGYGTIILLVLSVLPIVVQLIVYSLTLKLAAAVTEPLGNEQMSNYLSKVSGMVNVLIALVLGVAFIYFVFILLVVMTGNITL